MSVFVCLLAAAAAAGTSPAESHRPAGRFDLHLERLVQSHRGEGPLAFPAAAGDLSDAREVALYARAVSAAAAESLAAGARALGGDAVVLAEDLVAARLPLAALDAFGRSPFLVRAETAWPRRPLLDRSIPAIGADQVVRGDGLALPLTGRGVVLGLVDTGLDYRHPAFASEDGGSRVRGLWDQTLEGTPPVGFDSGHLCSEDTIEDETCPSVVDVIGHGTHVAATAGGRDRSYPGVAPDVDFLVAKSLTFELLAASAKWIFDEATARGMPAVINMSLGGHFGAHDGTGLEEAALDALLGPGRILVVAAGNEGDTPLHLGYALGETEGRTQVLISPGFGSSGGFIDIWGTPGSTYEVRVRVVRGRDTEQASTGFVAAGEVFGGRLRDVQGADLGNVQISFASINQANGKRRANVVIAPSSQPNTFAGNPGGYTWLLELRGEGRFDAWIASPGLLGGGAVFGTEAGDGLTPGDARSTVAMPGTASRALTSAAWTTRNAWLDRDGNPYEEPERPVGDIAFFSSSGPSAEPARTGHKPELAAPGQYIAAPFGQNAVVFDRSMFLEEDIVAMRGTSMAAPHLAGVVALLLEADPFLTPEDIEALLIETAATDLHTGPVPNDRWGYGKVDAWAAASAVVGRDTLVEGGDSGGCGCTGSGGAPLVSLLLVLVLLTLRRR